MKSMKDTTTMLNQGDAIELDRIRTHVDRGRELLHATGARHLLHCIDTLAEQNRNLREAVARFEYDNPKDPSDRSDPADPANPGTPLPASPAPGTWQRS